MRVINSDEWLEYVIENVRADFDTGLLYWKLRMRGRRVGTPLGCLDNNGYVKVQIAKRSTYAHSVVFFLFNGYWADLIDHDNQDRADNRPENLLDSDYSSNAFNAKMWSTNTSGIKGASITRHGKFKVTKGGVYLGTFNTAREAKDAYNQYR